MKQKFYTQYDRPPKVFQKVGGKKVVERQGYVSAKRKIENMIAAGIRLVESRTEEFDFPDGNVDFNFDDPTRRTGFDMAEASLMAQELAKKLTAQHEEIKAEKAAKEAAENKKGGEKDVKKNSNVDTQDSNNPS